MGLGMGLEMGMKMGMGWRLAGDENGMRKEVGLGIGWGLR